MRISRTRQSSSFGAKKGLEFEADAEFAKGLRYSEHPNGDLVTIYYVTEHQWSRKRREAPVGDDGSKIQDRMIQAAKGLFSSGRFRLARKQDLD